MPQPQLDLQQSVTDVMPEVIQELKEMVAIPSVAFPTFPSEPVHAMADKAVAAFNAIGVPARLMDIPDGYPAVWAEIPGPPGSPVVLLYGHYDVQPAPADQGWDTDPFTATVKEDGRIYGRGVADDKSGIAIHLAALKAFGGKPPVTVKLILEGEEETVSHLDDFVDANPELFQADVMIVADMGNLAVGQPVLTTDLRGDVKAVVEAATVKDPVHSGLFGGAAPDALLAMIKLLATLTDSAGDCAIDGLVAHDWQGATYDEATLRSNAGVLPGVDLVGSGGVAGRLWSKPSVTVLGMDCPTVDKGGNVLQPRARALIGLRIPPGQEPDAAYSALESHLLRHATGGVQLTVTKRNASPAFHQPYSGQVIEAMASALEAAYGAAVSTVGSGGSIPLLEHLRMACPTASFVLIGAQDATMAQIHGPNESVDPREIAHMATAEALFLSAMSPPE